MADDAATKDIERKIEREKALINAANQMRQAYTNNQSVSERLQNNIRDGRKNISYLEEKLTEMRERQMGNGMSDMSLSNNGGPPPPVHGGRIPQGGQQQSRQTYEDPGSYGKPGPGGYSQGGGQALMPPRAPYAPPAPGAPTPKARPNYSRLGMRPDAR